MKKIKRYTITGMGLSADEALQLSINLDKNGEWVKYEDMPAKKIELHNAVKKLAQELKNDTEFYNAYKSNIAMAFYDEYNRWGKRYKNRTDIHAISNNAAMNFLNTFIGCLDMLKEKF